MYVVPAARRRGVSRAVLGALEGAARSRGWTTLRLETGPLQDHVDPAWTGSAQHQPSDRHPAGPSDQSRTSSDDPPVKSHR